VGAAIFLVLILRARVVVVLVFWSLGCCISTAIGVFEYPRAKLLWKSVMAYFAVWETR
jgi:hypothetical protein